MAVYINKELWEAAEKFLADYEKKRAERIKIILSSEKFKPYESLDDILIKRCHLTQEQIDHYRFRSDRSDYDAMIQRFLNTEF